MHMKIYAGIGSRHTPPPILEIMTNLARDLDAKGWVLRSGGAEGADSAFEAGSTNSEIYLPYKGFNNNKSQRFHLPLQAIDSVAKFHPAPHRLGPAAKKLMARNWCQICGYEDPPVLSKFVVCWTDGGMLKGGTSQALRIAASFKIPIFNLFHSDRDILSEISQFIKEFEENQ